MYRICVNDYLQKESVPKHSIHFVTINTEISCTAGNTEEVFRRPGGMK